jgi:hypothetical protein
MAIEGFDLYLRLYAFTEIFIYRSIPNLEIESYSRFCKIRQLRSLFRLRRVESSTP